MQGSSFIPLPKKLKVKNAILNIENFEDNKCFLWCLLAQQLDINWENSPDNISHYEAFENELHFENISFPLPYQKMKQVEEQNNLLLNALGYEKNHLTLLHISKREDPDVINLLLIAHEQKQYTLI